MNFFAQEQIEKIRSGFYSAVYFNRTKEILLKEKIQKNVTMQVFQKNDGSTLCGIEEVIELFKEATGYRKEGEWVSKFADIAIETLQDGDQLKKFETVLHITGPYAYFAHLESLYLGILARRTLVATNSKKAVMKAAGKKVVFFADRFDYFLNQTGDGYAAKIGGASAVCTQAMTEGFGSDPVGTIPHALIAYYGGNTILAAQAFAKTYPKVPLIVLVDFENDCVKTAVDVAKELKEKLYAVRIDTAENMTDKSLSQNLKVTSQKLQGVNPLLVRNVRNALDQEGFSNVQIVVSGGFDEKKIEWFENEKTPVDMYGVGSALLKGNNDFTADIVNVDGKPISKVGRSYKKIRKDSL